MAIGALVGLLEVGLLHIQGWIPYFVAALVIQAFLVFNAMACYLYTAELYPTRMRAWGTSSGRSVSLIASVIGPLSVGGFLAGSLGAGGMFAMFLLSSLIGLVVILWLGVETMGRTLEEIST
jgi:putative MFS transporter